MRNLALRSGVVASLFAAMAVAAACGGDDTSSGSTDDGGTGDATTSDVVTPQDGGADANGPGPATLTLLDSANQPFAGGKVVFYDTHGAPQPPITTGADGKATMTVEAGWSVAGSGTTAASVSSGAQTYVTTFVGIEPGDDLTTIVAYSAGKSPVNDHVTVQIPSGISGSATHIMVTDGCDSVGAGGSASVQLAVNPSCERTLGDGGTAIDVFLYATDVDGQIIQYAQATDLPYVASMTVSGMSLVAGTPRAITTTGTPPSDAVSYYFYSQYLAHDLAFGYDYLNRQADGGVAGLSMGTPAGSFLDQLAFNVQVEYPFANGYSPVRSRYTYGASDGGFALDFDALLPKIHDSANTSDDAGTVGISFQADAPITGADGELAEVAWFTPTPGDSGHTDGVTWSIVSPAAVTIAPPKLTNDLVAFVPGSDAFLAYVTVYKGTPFGSYAAFRKGFLQYNQINTDKSKPYTLDMTAIIAPL